MQALVLSAAEEDVFALRFRAFISRVGDLGAGLLDDQRGRRREMSTESRQVGRVVCGRGRLVLIGCHSFQIAERLVILVLRELVMTARYRRLALQVRVV